MACKWVQQIGSFKRQNSEHSPSTYISGRLQIILPVEFQFGFGPDCAALHCGFSAIHLC